MPIDFDVEPEFQTQIDWVEKFTKEEIEGIRRCFVLYVKMPKDRWDDIRKAESLTPEGDKMLLSLKKECAEKYMNYGDHDATEGVDMVDFEK